MPFKNPGRLFLSFSLFLSSSAACIAILSSAPSRSTSAFSLALAARSSNFRSSFCALPGNTSRVPANSTAASFITCPLTTQYGARQSKDALLWRQSSRHVLISFPCMRFHRGPVWGFVLALAGLFILDAVIFRTPLYTSILEPESSAGTFELILRREQSAQPWYGRNLVITLGDSRFAYYPRVANEHTAETGFSFRQAGVAGTDARAWYYMLRDLDPTRQRYRAVVLGVDDYDDEDGAYDIGDDLATLHYVAARLRFADVIPFTFSFSDTAARWQALRGSLLKGTVFQRDLLAFLAHPQKRLANVDLVNGGYEEWTYGYHETDHNVTGLQIDWNNLTAVVPPGNE